MSGDNNAHIADCDQDKLPSNTSYKGTLCCSVQEICYDGKDNDGDGLVDCADPECNGANIGSPLDPFGADTTPQVCHNPSSCPQTVHVGTQGFWQFENTTNDSSGNNNDITTLSGDYTNYIDGKIGQALELNGGTEEAVIPDDTGFFETLDPEQGITVAAYINPDTTVGAQGIVGKDTNAPYQLYLSGSNLQFSVETTGGVTDMTVGSVNASEWTHVAGTYNASTGELTGYIDGTPANTMTITSNDLSQNNDNVHVGSIDGSDYFDGRIDQPRIHNREMTDAEVSSFTNYQCQNRQRTIDCVNNPELCNTSYNSESGYHCSFGQYDDPQQANYSGGQDGTGVCCPKDEFAEKTPSGWTCSTTDQCGMGSGTDCVAPISSNKSEFLANKSDGNNDACNSQIPNLNEDLDETTEPEGSQACCYVPKKGVTGYWYKDGNVKVYG